ncbi:MAG: copper amine oxidase N-terminal domain-containing protein, partial [Bacillota bacterium]
MKKTRKSFLVIILVLAMILSGTMTAFGAETNSAKVQYNGENIQFTGATKLINGRIMVPFRQILEGMGAEVTYDSSTKTLTAKIQEKEISFSVGGTEIAVNENDAVTSATMETAPYFDKESKSVYVPVRDVAESLGYSVGWDADDRTVIIIDPETLFGSADEDFSIISKLIKSDLDLEKSYQTDGKFDMNVATYADPESFMPPVDVTVTGKISGIQQKSNADLVMSLAFNFDKMLKSLTSEEQMMFEPMLKMYQDINMKIKMDGETGVTYMNSNIFSVMDPTADKNTWYKMNIYDNYESMGIDMKSITSMSYSDMDISEMLEESIENLDYADTSTYAEMKTTYAFLKNLIGNDAFKRKTAGAYVTYTLDLDKTTILAAMAKTALTEGISKDFLDMTEIGETL